MRMTRRVDRGSPNGESDDMRLSILQCAGGTVGAERWTWPRFPRSVAFAGNDGAGDEVDAWPVGEV